MSEGAAGFDDALVRAALAAAGAGALAWSLETDVVELSPEAARLLGLAPGAFAGTRAALLALVHDDDRTRAAAELALVARDGAPWASELRIAPPGGAPRWVEVRGALAPEPGSSRLLAIVGAVDDAARLDHSLRRVFEHTPGVAIQVYDGEGRVLAWNPASARLFGFPAEEALGRTLDALIQTPEEAAAFRETLARIAATGTPVGPSEYAFRRRDGARGWCLSTTFAIPGEGGRPRFVCMDVDLTAHRQLEEGLRRAQKLEGIGRLAGGVAHDFNNLLTSVLGHTALAQRLAPPPDVAEHLAAIALAAQHGGELTGQLLAFARRQHLAPQDVDLNAKLVEVDRLLRRVLGEHIELVTRPSPDAPSARVDPGQLSQVLINLALNARDAMPGGGRLTIECGTATLEPDAPARPPEVQPGRYALLVVSDTGAGISEEDRVRLFEPFFTTKQAGAGTGLGLATCYGIVRQHGGHIAIESELGRGTTCRVYLPPGQGPLAPAAPAAPPPAPGRGGETVFVCEDDPSVRRVLVELLATSGFRVEAAARAEELLARVVAHAGPIDLLVTDLVMPGLGGAELAQRVQALRPRVPVLFISGYAEHALARGGRLGPGQDLLAKPFRLDELLRRVRLALDRAPP